MLHLVEGKVHHGDGGGHRRLLELLELFLELLLAFGARL